MRLGVSDLTCNSPTRCCSGRRSSTATFDRVHMAQTHLHSAAYNWRLALRLDEAKRVEERADKGAKMGEADLPTRKWPVGPTAWPTPNWEETTEVRKPLR